MNQSLFKIFDQLETPFYFYDMELLHRTLKSVSEASKRSEIKVHYALKANSEDHILKAIHSYGIGADCVSGNEIRKALEIGFPAEKIVFAGVGKTDKEIRYALEQRIFCLNVESIQELIVVDEIAGSMNCKAPIALRINPNIDAETHQYITTGKKENKFGICEWEFETLFQQLISLNNVELNGLHFHIGSQIENLRVFQLLSKKVSRIAQFFTENNHAPLHLNLGGGLGVDYKNPEKNIPDFQNYFDVFNRHLDARLPQQLHVELGRSITAQCGDLVTRVLYMKEGRKSKFAIVDAGMTELMRPALYQAYHKIINISKSGEQQQNKYDIVGPICESSDCFGKDMPLPETSRGDLLSIKSVGAYGQVMASRYNLRDFAKSHYSDHILHISETM